MSNRYQDTINSKEVEKFLNKYLYKKEFERVSDKARQLKGIDVIYGDYIIDEKCALDYINKNLQTFSFELSSVNKSGQRYDGWLINKELETTHYLLCYINKCKVDRNPTCEAIEEMEVILVEKKKLIDFIEAKCDRLPEIIKVAKSVSSTFNHKGFKIIKSNHKAESPINILVRREDLRNISKFHKVIIVKDEII